MNNSRLGFIDPGLTSDITDITTGKGPGDAVDGCEILQIWHGNLIGIPMNHGNSMGSFDGMSTIYKDKVQYFATIQRIT